MEVDIITLENGNNYMVMEKQEFNNQQYLFLVNENNKSDFVIRKIVGDNLVGLTDENELTNVLKRFINIKYMELENE